MCKWFIIHYNDNIFDENLINYNCNWLYFFRKSLIIFYNLLYSIIKDYNPVSYQNLNLREKWNIMDFNLAILHENTVKI